MMVQLLITNQTIYRVRPATAELQQSSQTAQIKLQHSVTQSTIKLALTFYLPVLSRPERQRYKHVYTQCTLIKWLILKRCQDKTSVCCYCLSCTFNCPNDCTRETHWCEIFPEIREGVLSLLGQVPTHLDSIPWHKSCHNNNILSSAMFSIYPDSPLVKPQAAYIDVVGVSDLLLLLITYIYSYRNKCKSKSLYFPSYYPRMHYLVSGSSIWWLLPFE